MKKQSGLTLIELMVTMVVAIILMGVGLPIYQSVVANNRAVTQANTFVTALQTARSEAASRMVDVVVCARQSDTSCGGSGDWADGWLLFIDDDPANGSLDAAEVADQKVLRVFGALPSGATVAPAGSTASLVFSATGGISATENFEMSVSHTKGIEPRCIRVYTQGLVRQEKNACP